MLAIPVGSNNVIDVNVQDFQVFLKSGVAVYHFVFSQRCGVSPEVE